MRKITLFALAALASTSVFAGVNEQANPAAVAKNNLVKAAKVATFKTDNVRFDGTMRKEGEAAAINGNVPSYVSTPAFYMCTLAPDTKTYYSVGFGFLPSSGKFGFANLVTPEAESNKWSWENYEINEAGTAYDTIPSTESSKNLIWNLEPMMRFSAPTLETTTGAASTSYVNKTKTYFTSGSPAKWGFYNGGDDEEATDLTKMFGCSPCETPLGDNFFRGSEYTKSIGGGASFDENGVSTSWAESFAENDPDLTDVKISGFSYQLPDMGRPYQMSGMNLLCMSNTLEESTLTATVYGYNAEGKVDRTKVYGKGTVILPKGQYGGFIFINLRAIGALGLPTNNPLVINGECFVELTGVDNDNITLFSPFINGNLYVNMADWGQQIWRTVYPSRSTIDFVGVNKNTQETENAGYYFGGGYLSEDDENVVQYASEMCMYFVINYPIVMDMMTGQGDCAFDAPAEGGSESFYIYSDEDLAQLFADGKFKAEGIADWTTVTDIALDETISEQVGLPIYVIDVTAAALPSGETGRTAKINYTGYACDFTLTVKQGDGGEENSINEVKNVVAGAAEYFDLQGRKLNAAPAKGLYIERNGSAASTKLAR